MEVPGVGGEPWGKGSGYKEEKSIGAHGLRKILDGGKKKELHWKGEGVWEHQSVINNRS